MRPGRLPGMVPGCPVAQGPGQLPAPRRGVDRVNGPHGMGGPDRAVKQRGTQRRHEPRHPCLDHARPSLVVDGPREIPDPLRETVVGAEGLPPLEAGRRHRFDPRPACPGERRAQLSMSSAQSSTASASQAMAP